MTIENLTIENLKDLLKEYPLLHIAGYGYADRESARIGKPYIDAKQVHLLEKIDSIKRVIYFLEKHATETKRITTKSSYHWKHVIEESLMDAYIENGVFIAAALLAGYRMKPDPGYNPCFNMTIDPTKDN